MELVAVSLLGTESETSHYFLPMLMFGSREAEPEWAIAIFDLDFLMLLVGVALLSVSQLAEEAEALRAENEQFV